MVPIVGKLPFVDKADFFLIPTHNIQTKTKSQIIYPYRNPRFYISSQNSTTFKPIADSLLQNVAIVAVPTVTQHPPESYFSIFYRLWTRIETIDSDYLLELLSKIMINSGRYFGEYKPFNYPFEKLDLVVVPHQQVSETLVASFGLIVIPENTLLTGRYNSSEIIRAVTRACMRIWLKNVIVPKTGDETSFIDGLIKYYEYFFNEENLDASRNFFIDVQQRALLEDDLDENFLINKAASIFWMIKSTFEENFDKAMQKFFKAR